MIAFQRVKFLSLLCLAIPRRAARVLPRHAGMHPGPRGFDDGPVPDALRPQTPVILRNHGHGLPTDERTLPQALKEAGYQTAMVGKWLLSHADKKYWPQNRGFDHFYGNLVGEVDYFTKMRRGIVDWQRDGKAGS